MGININTLRMLARVASHEVSFGDTLTVGRQELHVNKTQATRVLEASLPNVDPKSIELALNNTWAELVLELFGASNVCSLDANAFEGAKLVFDLNKQIPMEHHSTFDTVIDGGTLEHIFDVRQGWSNLLSLPKLGGNIILHHPADSYFGHGFYQFGPELYFRVLSWENGYRIREIYIHQGRESNRWLALPDPKELGRRTWRHGSSPTMILVWAERIKIIQPFSNGIPQQSDYAAQWDEGKALGGQAARGKAALRKMIHTLIPLTIRKRLIQIASRHDRKMTVTRISP